MPPTLTVAMIVKDVAAYIGPCIASFRMFADELVVVDTGSTDSTRDAIEQAWARRTKPLVFIGAGPAARPDLHMMDDEGLAEHGVLGPYSGKTMLCNFGAARQLGWERASCDYIMWLDSDDVVAGAEHLPAVIEEMHRDRVDTAMVGYDYAHDGQGNVTCRLLRERIVRRGSEARWMQPVHEVLCPIGAARDFHQIRIVHRRQDIGPKTDVPNRNLKILLKRYTEEKQRPEGVDARLLFYLGMETRFVDQERSLGFLQEYLRKSGWDEERATARIWIGEMLEGRRDFEGAFTNYAAAVMDFPHRPDGLFMLSRNFYYRNDWRRCVEFAERGWAQSNDERPSVIQFDPLTRTLWPYVYASVAYLNLGRIQETLQCCEKGLAIRPDEPHLLGNKKAAENWLMAQAAGKQPDKVSMSMSEPLEAPARQLHTNAYVMFAVELWKRLRDDGDLEAAMLLLDSLPRQISSAPRIQEARKMVARTMAPQNGKDKWQESVSR